MLALQQLHRIKQPCAVCITLLCRRTLAMLGDAGYEAYAPDWPGHGSSSKPSSSGGVFNYSQAAYLAALEAFVAAVGLDKQPYALVVQVRRRH